MIKRLEEKLRDYLLGNEPEFVGPHPSQSNLLLGYFKLIHRQYRSLFLLYIGLLVGLGSLLLVVGLLVASTAELLGAPPWALYSLAGVVVILLFTLARAVLGLVRLRKKNQQWVAAVMDQLIEDLKPAQRPLKRRRPSGAATPPLSPAKTLGWDVKSCPDCGEMIELLDEVCPHCLHLVGPPEAN